MLGKLNKRQIEIVINSETIGRLGCAANDEVFVVPLTYAYDGTFLYFHTIEGHKIKIMRQQPMVCFQIDQIENAAHWRSVVIQGVYEELDGEEAEEAMVELLNRLHPLMASETSRPKHALDRPRELHKVARSVVFRIKILDMSGRFERQ